MAFKGIDRVCRFCVVVSYRLRRPACEGQVLPVSLGSLERQSDTEVRGVKENRREEWRVAVEGVCKSRKGKVV